MTTPYTGSCLCGRFRLTVSSDPIAVISCFCSHCAKNAGGPLQVIAKFDVQDVQVTTDDGCVGEYTLADTSSGSPKVKTFCRTCGCTMWTVPSSAQGKFYLIRTSLLDQGRELKPQNELFVRNRPSWMQATEGATQWDGIRK